MNYETNEDCPKSSDSTLFFTIRTIEEFHMVMEDDQVSLIKFIINTANVDDISLSLLVITDQSGIQHPLSISVFLKEEIRIAMREYAKRHKDDCSYCTVLVSSEEIVTLRKMKRMTLNDLYQQKFMSFRELFLIKNAIRNQSNILIYGTTHEGKNALLSAILLESKKYPTIVEHCTVIEDKSETDIKSVSEEVLCKQHGVLVVKEITSKNASLLRLERPIWTTIHTDEPKKVQSQLSSWANKTVGEIGKKKDFLLIEVSRFSEFSSIISRDLVFITL